MSDVPDTITVGVDGMSLPVVELLTGRGFVTGKSGSGKSNTASVICEELLNLNLPLLIVDTDGEYYGLKERYEVLHVGADAQCDVEVGPDQAEAIARLALEEHVPVVLDVSGYISGDEGRQLIQDVVRELFVREKRAKQPFLLLVEEVHEYLPESGGSDELSELLVQVAKRGRKRGLGLCGISQRPAAVDKDFITQCDWLCWHRLTWENDTKVVSRFLDSDWADQVEDLDNGQAVLVTDWDEQVRLAQFRRKDTFDAGATPGLEDIEPPSFESVDAELRASLRDSGVADPAEDESAESTEADESDSVDEASLLEDEEEENEEPPTDSTASSATTASGTTATTPPSAESDMVMEFAHLLGYAVAETARRLIGLWQGAVARTRAWVRKQG
jgi:hypothetical protein